MNIAYLIPVHNNPKHLERLVGALQYPDCDFYIHIDKKTKVHFKKISQKNVYYLKNTISVFWGGYSQVEATLRLLKTAVKTKKYDYFILISGVDYPVRSNKFIHTFFKQNKETEFINFCTMPENNKGFDRLENINFDGSDIGTLNHLFNILQNILKKLPIKRKFPEQYSNMTHYGGSTWWALSGNCVSYILNFIDRNPEFVNFYKHTYNADEMFFQTIIGNSPFKKKIQNAVTYADWKTRNPGLPAILTKKHLPVLTAKEIDWSYGNKKITPLFARKFTDKSEELIKEIERTIRNK